MNGWTVHGLAMTAALLAGALAVALAVAEVRRERSGRATRALVHGGARDERRRAGRRNASPGGAPEPGPVPGVMPAPRSGSRKVSGPGPDTGWRPWRGPQAGAGPRRGLAADAGAASRLWPEGERAAGTRAGSLPRAAPGQRRDARSTPADGKEARPRAVGGLLREWGLAAAAGVGAAALVGGLLGVLAGTATVWGMRAWLARRQVAPADAGQGGRPDPAGLPLCADLMAACLAAGASPGEAAEAVGRCVDGPWGAALIRTRAELRFGAEPEECWERFGRLPGAREMGRCLGRASLTGSAPVAEMSRLAADYRAAQARSALGRARRAAVLATAPLGLCFLPAFLLVGVAPVVMGLAGAILGGRPG